MIDDIVQFPGIPGKSPSPPPALVIIDIQNAIDHPRWAVHGPRNNPDAEKQIARLLEVWRSRNLPIYHVRHDSLEPDSAYRPCQPGNAFKPEAEPLPGEPIVVKHTASAFVNTGLEQRLKAAGHTRLVVTGVITNNSVESTVRMAGDLGFETCLVEDACFTFARPDRTRQLRSAEEVHAMSLANLDGEYCSVLTADEAIRRVIGS